MVELPIQVDKLRVWLQRVHKTLSPSKWVLLLLCYFDNFPFGMLEKLQDPADLYNRLVCSDTFSNTEVFQLLLNRLALLGSDGRKCIDLLQEFELAQPESCPELGRKISQESRLMEAIVAVLVKLTQQQQERLVKLLGTTLLKYHEGWCTTFGVISELRHQQIVTAMETQPFLDALRNIRAPKSAIDPLYRYHMVYRLDLGPFGKSYCYYKLYS